MHRGSVSYRRSNNSNFYGRGRGQNRQTYNQTPRHVQANYTYRDAVSNNTNSVVDTTSDKLDRLLKAFDSLEGRLTKMEGLQHTMTSRSGPTNGNHPRDRSRPKQQQQQQQQQPKERSNNPDFAEMTKNLYKVVQLNHQMGHWENDLPLSLQRQFNNLINMIRPADPTTEVQEAISSALRKAGEEVRTAIFNHLRERQLHHLHCLRKCNPEDGDRAKDMAFNWLADRLGKKIPAVIIERKLDEAYRSVQPRPNPPQTGTSSIDPPQQGTTTTTSSSSNYITPSNPTKKRKVVVSPVLETSNRFDALTPAVVDDDDDDNDDDDDTEAVRQIEHMSAHTTKANTIKRINRHSGQAKNFWKIKLLPETRTLVVSDSNMKLMKEEEVPDDWQLEVFSGAKIDHVSKLLEELGTDAPTNIVTCVGINHRSHQDSSISKYVRGLRTATGRSPAMVFTMGVSISPHLPATEQQALRTVNERLLADHGERYIVPILPQDVKTGPDGIHYTEETTKKHRRHLFFSFVPSFFEDLFNSTPILHPYPRSAAPQQRNT